MDRNGDGCSLAGAGFPGHFHDRASLTGFPAPGPCCVAGQSTTLVAAGTWFTGGPPLFDIGFIVSIPNSVVACDPYPATPATCTVTTDPCLD